MSTVEAERGEVADDPGSDTDGTQSPEPPLRALDLRVALRRMRRLWPALSLALLVAIAMGVTSAYQVSLIPPSVKSKQLGYATATVDIVFDTRRSTLSDASRPLEPLTARASLLAARLRGDEAQDALAARIGVPASELAVTSATYGNPRSFNAVNDPIQRANSLRFQGARYQLLIDPRSEIPVIAVSALAPTIDDAARLATAVEGILREILDDKTDGIADGNRLVISGGRPAAGTISEGSSWPVALVVTFFVFLGLVLIVLLLANVFDSARRGSGGP